MYSTLITATQLYENLRKPGFVLVDCRFDLSDPEWGSLEYSHLHIPGAVYAHLDKDLSGEKTAQTGRHPLPDARVFESTASRLGISNSSQVVCYDSVGGAFAARLWWLLRYFGHEAVAVLDGGFSAWLSAGFPTASGIEKNQPGSFQASPRPEMSVSAAEVEEIRKSSAYILIDARSAERYRGEIEPIDRVAGRIPGAVNRFHQLNLNPDFTMKPPELLRQEFLKQIGSHTPENVVVYCGSGVTSCHHLLAMEHAGLKGARLYPGSFSEWITDPNRPIAKG